MKRLMLLCFYVILIGVVTLIFARQEKPAARGLDIYYIDVEGGAATLIVTPARESVLIDAGWPGFDGRDAKRIEKAMKSAGIDRIDHLVATHYHTDHYGGIPELAKLVKIDKFYDHGPLASLDEDKGFAAKYAAYQAATKGKSITLNPADTILLDTPPGTRSSRTSLTCLAARAETLSGGKGRENQECADASLKSEDKSDNARSIALVLDYGDFDFLVTGDLTWNVEQKLVCPVNMIGEIDLYQVAHHGMNISNNRALLRSIKPEVAIMNNGPRKGGHPDTVKALLELPTLKDLWQVHRNVTSGPEENAPADFIANLEEQNDEAHMIRVSVDAAKRTFSVTNDRNGKSKTYQIK
jgi:competence protein ComEC